MKRKIFVFILLIMLSIICFSIYKINKYYEYANSILLQTAIYTPGNESYYFALLKDGTLYGAYGIKKRDEIKLIPYLRSVEEEGEKKLTELELQRLIELADQLSTSDNDWRHAFGGFYVETFYKKTSYFAEFQLEENEKLTKFSEELMNLSPIPVVLLAGSARDYYFEKQALQTWVGDYTFNEFAAPNISISYAISIYEEEGHHFADITIDGYQRLAKMKARVRGNKESIKLIFEEYYPDNPFDLYKKWELLLTLQKEDDDLLTVWGKIKPAVKGSQEGFQYVD